MKTIAICFNLPNLETGMTDPKLGKHYPGAGWMPQMVNLTEERGYSVMAGDQAVRYVQHGLIDPSHVQVIQEETNPAGMELILNGAEASILTCLESPIFTPHFYDKVNSIKIHYKNSVLFSGGTEQLYFPSFDDEDLRDPEPWEGRDFLCMVISNKHYSGMPQSYRESPAFQRALTSQLHDYRYNAIGYFYDRPGFKLYGRGWGDGAGACDDKLATIRGYKFALCFENGIYPGYVTEKLIDCLVAGTIPVYRGTFQDWMPRSAYIDASQFESFELMEKFLREMDPSFAEYTIQEGQAWLRSPEGQRHNCRVWAGRLMELIA